MANLLKDINGKRKALLLIAAACVLGVVLVGGVMWLFREPEVIVVVEPQDAAPAYSQVDMEDYWITYAITVPYTTTLGCYQLQYGDHYTSDGKYVGDSRLIVTGPIANADLCGSGYITATQWYKVISAKEQSGGYQEGCDPDCGASGQNAHMYYLSDWASYDDWGGASNPIVWVPGFQTQSFSLTMNLDDPMSSGMHSVRAWPNNDTVDPTQVWLPHYLKSTNDTSCTGCEKADWSTGIQYWNWDWTAPHPWGSDWCDMPTHVSHAVHDIWQIYDVGEMTIVALTGESYTGNVLLWTFSEKLEHAYGFEETWYLMENYGILRIDQTLAHSAEDGHNPKTICIISNTIDYGG